MLESSPVLAHSLLYATLSDLWDQPCNGGESLSTISNAKAQLGFAREGTNILKVCWDLKTCSVGIVHNAGNISQVTRLTPFFQWGDKPGGAWPAWLLSEVNIHYQTPPSSLEVSYHVLWEKLFFFFLFLIQGWLGSRWTNGWWLPLSTAWISQKVLWKVTHASALILTVWISHLIWHITHHLYMYIIIENVSIKKKYLILFSPHQRSKFSLKVDINLGSKPCDLISPITSQENRRLCVPISFSTWASVTIQIIKSNTETQDLGWVMIHWFSSSRIISVSFGEPSRSEATQLPHRRALPSINLYRAPTGSTALHWALTRQTNL